jgi:metal-responsive CopG/Arc/MetJ family transcriptional regulator
MMTHAKLAISLPDVLFAEVSRRAQSAAASRSEVISKAIERFLYDAESRRIRDEIEAAMAQETLEEKREREAWLAFGRRQARQRIERGDW